MLTAQDQWTNPFVTMVPLNLNLYSFSILFIIKSASLEIQTLYYWVRIKKKKKKHPLHSNMRKCENVINEL